MKIWRLETQIQPALITGKGRDAVPSRGANFPIPSGPRGRWRSVRGAVGFAARTRSRTDQPGRRGDCRVSPRRPVAAPGWAVGFPPPAVLRRPRGGIWVAAEPSRRRRQKNSAWSSDKFVNHSEGGQSGLGHQFGTPKKSAKYLYPLCAVRPPSRPRRPRVRKKRNLAF